MQIDHICANPSCNCRVEHRGDYCSESCKRIANDKGVSLCECGHADCGTSTPQTHGVPDQNESPAG